MTSFFPCTPPSHQATENLSRGTENSFNSKEFYLIFKMVDEGVNMCGSLAGHQEKMENQQ